MTLLVAAAIFALLAVIGIIGLAIEGGNTWLENHRD